MDASVFIYLLTVFTSVMYYSEWQLENVMYPVLYLFKEVTLPFLERVDVLAISLVGFSNPHDRGCFFMGCQKRVRFNSSERKKESFIHYSYYCIYHS